MSEKSPQVRFTIYIDPELKTRISSAVPYGYVSETVRCLLEEFVGEIEEHGPEMLHRVLSRKSKLFKHPDEMDYR